jgi:hypothetical protein
MHASLFLCLSAAALSAAQIAAPTSAPPRAPAAGSLSVFFAPTIGERTPYAPPDATLWSVTRTSNASQLFFIANAQLPPFTLVPAPVVVFLPFSGTFTLAAGRRAEPLRQARVLTLGVRVDLVENNGGPPPRPPTVRLVAPASRAHLAVLNCQALGTAAPSALMTTPSTTTPFACLLDKPTALVGDLLMARCGAGLLVEIAPGVVPLLAVATATHAVVADAASVDARDLLSPRAVPPVGAVRQAVVELRPTSFNATDAWIELAAEARAAPLFSFRQADRSASVALLLSGFVAVDADRDKSLWPPPPQSSLVGIVLSLESEFSMDLTATALVIGGMSAAVALDGNDACDVAPRQRQTLGTLDLLPFAVGSTFNLSAVALQQCGGLSVRLGLRLPPLTATGTRHWPAVLSALRLHVSYRHAGGAPAPASSVSTVVFAAGSAAGGPVGWLERYNRLFAIQSGVSGARLAVPLLAADFPLNGTTAPHELVLGRFGAAALPSGAVVQRLLLSLDHAVLASRLFALGNFSSATFEWRKVALRASATGRELATAADLRACSGGRPWPAERCRSSGVCLSTLAVSDWRRADGERVVLSRGELASCDFVVVASFVRTADRGSGPMDSDAARDGLRGNGLSLDLSAASSGAAIAAVIGAATLTVQYSVGGGDGGGESRTFATAWIAGAPGPGTQRAKSALTDGGTQLDAQQVAQLDHPSLSRGLWIDDYGDTVDARGNAENKQPNAPAVDFKTAFSFPVSASQVPRVGDVVGVEVELLQQWRCSVPVPTSAASPFLKSLATRRAERCGLLVDAEYAWTLGGSDASDSVCFANRLAWPIADQLTRRTVGGPQFSWRAGLTTGDVLRNMTLVVTSRLLRRSLVTATFGYVAARARVHFRSTQLQTDVGSGCSLRTRRDGAAYLLAPSTAIQAAGGLVAMSVALSSRTQSVLLLSFAPSDDVAGAFVLTLGGGVLELLQLQAANANNATLQYVSTVAVPVALGAARVLSLAWNATAVCVQAAASERCAALPLDALERAGALAVGGLAPRLPSVAQSGFVEIDNVALYGGGGSFDRALLRRGWHDLNDPNLVAFASFTPANGSTACVCGTAPYANEAQAAGAASGLQLIGVDCNVGDCQFARLLPQPTASADGSVSLLSGSDVQLAAHAARLCNASIDAAAAQPAKLSHVYRVRGNGTLISASTCRGAVQDTRVFVFRASLCGALADTTDRSKCVAHNDDSLRGPRGCPNGGAEVTWLGERDVEYVVVVATPYESASADAPRSFSLDVQACAVPRCPSLPSCFACAHLSTADAPHRVAIRDASVSRNLAIESRCVGVECDGGYSMRLRVAVQTSLVREPAAAAAGSALTFVRGNARISVTPVAVAPAVYVEPDFGGTLGNDNALFDAEAQLQHYCSNPLPLRYRVVLWNAALPSQVLPTNVTCQQSKVPEGSSAAVLNLVNDQCDSSAYEVTRIRCDAQSLPALDMAYEGRAISVCRPDMELVGVRTAVETADATQVAALRQMIEEALAKNEPAVDCNVPPIPSTVLNCSAAAAQNLTTKGVADMGLAFFKGALTGDDDARNRAAESLRVSREAARCEAKQREQEARDKLALALAKEDCWNCRTGPGVVVELIPEFGDETLCFVQQRRTTSLMARVTIEIDDEVVFSNVTVPLTQLGIGAGADAFRALFATPDPPVDAVLRRSLSSTNAAVDVDVAEAPADWVPFADGSARDWANDSCVRVPTSLTAAGGERLYAKALEASWARLSGEDAKKYLAAQQSQFGALAGDATKRFASSVVAKTGSGVPLGVAGVWQHLSEGGAATQRLTQLAFSMRGSLVGGLAPRGKVDESSVTAQIHVDVTSDPVYDTVAIAVQGQLFNVFNNSGEAYTFEVHCRDTNGLLLASWDVLQRVNETFRLESTLYFVADAATRNSSDTFQRYTTSYTIEIRDSTSLFAVLPSVNQTELSLYEAEQAKRADELDARLLPLVYFFGAGPAAALLVFIAGAVLQKLRPITDDDLYPRHIWVIVLYVALRVVRSLLLTTTAFRIIMGAALREPLATLEQLPAWVDSMSNKSAEVTNLANLALDRELGRQTVLFGTQQRRCDALLNDIKEQARQRRLDIVEIHASEMAARNLAGYRQQIADRRSADLMALSGDALAAEQEQKFCWKRWGEQVLNLTLDFEASFKAKLAFNLDAVTVRIDAAEADLARFKQLYDDFEDDMRERARKAKSTYDKFKTFIEAVDKVDFLDLGKLPSAGSAPSLNIDGPDLSVPKIDVPPLRDWALNFSVPRCPCLGAAPPPPPRAVADAPLERKTVAPAARSKARSDATAIPIPSLTLRSFISVPVLIDLFGWLPDLGWLASLLIVIDVLLVVFTHVRTVHGVVALLRGHIEDDEIVQDEALGARIARLCGCACGAAIIGLCLRCVDVAEVCLRRHRQILVQAAKASLQALLGLTAVALFALGMYILAEFASAILTVQALDGLGVVGAIVAPVTSALGSANVKAIENARAINTQTLLSAENSYNQALQDIAVLTDDFNAEQERELALFNAEFCALQEELATVQMNASAFACVDQVPQTLAVVVLDECPFWEEVVPRLYADISRSAFRDEVLSTVEPFVSALRRVVLDCIWLVAYVVIGVAVIFVISTAMYRLLVLVRMIRVRRRVIFESKGVLTSTYTTRKTADADSLARRRSSAQMPINHKHAADPEMFTVREDRAGEQDSFSSSWSTQRRSRRSSRRASTAFSPPSAGRLPPPPPTPTLHQRVSSRRRRQQQQQLEALPPPPPTEFLVLPPPPST